MRVELAYATLAKQFLVELDVADGACVSDVIAASSIEDEFPDDDLLACEVGIWGRIVARDAGVHEGDRVELYRPLPMDPRAARRMRARD